MATSFSPSLLFRWPPARGAIALSRENFDVFRLSWRQRHEEPEARLSTRGSSYCAVVISNAPLLAVCQVRRVLSEVWSLIAISRPGKRFLPLITIRPGLPVSVVCAVLYLRFGTAASSFFARNLS